MSRKVESPSLSRLETQRQTGRTTRMFEQAVESAKSGKPTVVYMKDVHSVRIWLEKMGDIPGLSIEPMRVRMPDMDWSQLKIVSGPFANHEQFFDHDVIYCQFRHVLLAWMQYDAVPEKETA